MRRGPSGSSGIRARNLYMLWMVRMRCSESGYQKNRGGSASRSTSAHIAEEDSRMNHPDARRKKHEKLHDLRISRKEQQRTILLLRRKPTIHGIRRSAEKVRVPHQSEGLHHSYRNRREGPSFKDDTGDIRRIIRIS